MAQRFRKGEAVVLHNEKFSFEGVNPDGSYLLKRWGTHTQDGIISAPANEVFSFLREGRSDSANLRKING